MMVMMVMEKVNGNKGYHHNHHGPITRSVSVPQSLMLRGGNCKNEAACEKGGGVYHRIVQKVPFLNSFLKEEEDIMNHDDDRFSVINQSLEDLSITAISEPQGDVEFCHRALQVPEILDMILSYVDSFNSIPHETAPKRRKPMSLQHALLLHGDTSQTRQEWHRSQSESRIKDLSTTPSTSLKPSGAGLYSCLFVNKFWYSVAVRLLYKQIHFKNEASWKSFITDGRPVDNARPTVFVLHKLSNVQQTDLHSLDNLGGSLEWLEFYTCPKIAPTRSLLSGGKMTKIVLPGSSRVDDKSVALIAECCPALEHLDLRACEKISDKGLKFIAKYCKSLKLLNVGRTQHGELVTHRGLKHIARRTQIKTLGVAGTAIEDRTIWDFAVYRGKDLERLSLNNCKLLTNKSVPRILKHTPNLSVLELRGCASISEMRPIVKFKRQRERMGRMPLIEGCELFELRMKEAEWLIEMEVSREVFRDCLEWIYADDDDVDAYELGMVRRAVTNECITID